MPAKKMQAACQSPAPTTRLQKCRNLIFAKGLRPMQQPGDIAYTLGKICSFHNHIAQMNCITYILETTCNHAGDGKRRLAMQSNPQGRTATILTFPTAARRTALNLGNKAKFSAELAALKDRSVDIDGWYHQAAIEDESNKPHKSNKPHN